MFKSAAFLRAAIMQHREAEEVSAEYALVPFTHFSVQVFGHMLRFGLDYFIYPAHFDCGRGPNKALETIGVGRFIFIHRSFLVAGHRRSPMSQLLSLDGVVVVTCNTQFQFYLGLFAFQ